VVSRVHDLKQGLHLKRADEVGGGQGREDEARQEKVQVGERVGQNNNIRTQLLSDLVSQF